MPRAQREFDSYIDKPVDGCWRWLGSKSEGYGRYRLSGRMVGAHRISWERTFGEIPDGLCVLHRCDNPECVNPAHLFLGTVDDNNKDRAAKGRSKGTFQSNDQHPARVRSGERHWHAKLSASDVQQIRARFEGGENQGSISKSFKVHSATISRIVRRQWRKEVA